MNDLLMNLEDNLSPDKDDSKSDVILPPDEDKKTPEADEEKQKQKGEEKKSEEENMDKEKSEEKPKEEKSEDEDKDKWWEDLSDDLDELDKILAELDDSWIQDAVKDVENAWEQTPEVKKLLDEISKKDSDMADLKQSLNDMQQRLKSVNQDKYDLTYKNAELEAFGWVTDPSLMIVVKNYEKAKGWDKVAQWKIKQMMSDMYAWVYGVDLDKETMDDKVSDITEINSYNSKKNPNVDIKDKDAFAGFVI